jgi:isopentenyl-diphosphate Delta-isomerase
MLNEEPLVILVDANDAPIGVAPKLAAHESGLCHRAFSIFILRKTPEGEIETLLQQRQINKYHCGGLWTNTCCSHPYPDEAIVAAGQRRLKEEMGLSIPLTETGMFHYIAHFDNGLIENEIDHVLVGYWDGQPLQINPEEVMNYAWVNIKTLPERITKNAADYTPWLLPALKYVSLYSAS